MIPPVIEQNIIIKCTVGSTVHGLQVNNQDDLDIMAVYIPPPEYVVGLDMPERTGLRTMEHYIERTQPEGVRSGPGDLDLTIYSLRKWMRLAVRGNPTVLLLLFAEPLMAAPLGRELQGMAGAIVSQYAGPRYVGYLQAQKARLFGERGGKHTTRQELVDAFGFDTKYAGHVIRLGYQGIELLTTGRLTLPMPEAQRTEIVAVRAVRTGQRSY